MVSEKRKIGDIGERVAERFLVKRGFSIRERNYLKPFGEIDIVAQKGNTLHFVEVKTVQTRLNVPRETSKNVSRETYNPAENVHRKKLQRLHRAIFSYLSEKRVSRETPWQLDVVIVRLDLDSKRAKVEIIENVV